MLAAMRRGMEHWRRTTALALVVAAVAAAAVAVPGAGAAASTGSCTGRSLLTCSEKDALFNASLLSDGAFALDSVLFELKLPVALSNPAINAFWRSDVSTNGALGIDDGLMINQLSDPDFEQVTTLPALSTPVVHRHGFITRKIARALTSAVDDEQTETLNVQAMLVSLDRATAASQQETRSDWLGYQEQKAAGFARTASAAIRRLIGAQRTVAGDFSRLRLRFGVGAVDLNLTRAKVKRSGLAPAITSGLRRLGATAAAITECAKGIAADKLDGTYSLTTQLDLATSLATERALANALSSFAASAPHGLPRPS
jgi:hypothetical protein